MQLGVDFLWSLGRYALRLKSNKSVVIGRMKRMKKLIAIAGIALMAGSSLALAGQPFRSPAAGVEITNHDRAAAAGVMPGELFSTTSSDHLGRTLVKTFRVQPDGTLKIVDINYTNYN